MGNVSDGIHETLLGAVEDDDSEEHGGTKDAETVEKTCDVEGASAEERVFEGLEDGGERIDVEEYPVLLRRETQGIDDWRGVHQELDAEAYQHIEVAVFGGHRRDDQSPRHGVHTYHED